MPEPQQALFEFAWPGGGPRFTTRPQLTGTFGMVAATHWLASSVAMAMLEEGGNAFDAAVAAGFMLQVVQPHLNGLGGEVPIIVAPVGAPVQVICGQGVAPAAATVERFESLGLDLVPGTGLLPAVVPGAFDAWMLLLRDHGTRPLRRVLEPAIGYARAGYPMLIDTTVIIGAVERLFRQEWPSSEAIWLPGGQVPAPGALFRNPALAGTYERLLGEAESKGADRESQIEAARNAFYRGFVAEAVERFYREPLLDISGERHAGLLAADDFSRWQATCEAPVTYDYRGLTVCKCGPWSQGPVFLQTLALLSGFDLASLDPSGPDFVHLWAEATKLAFADREAFYGDPNFHDVPLGELLGEPYNAARRGLIGSHASAEIRPGRGGGQDGRLAAVPITAAGRGSAGIGEPSATLALHRGDTCHLNIVDRHGNMVSATPSGGWLQSSPIVEGLGFSITTRGQMFWLEPGLPASLAPGKRPRTTLTPTLATRDGRAVLAFGTPGGDRQDQWSMAMFLRHVEHGMDLQQAIDAPVFHTDHCPSSFYPRTAKLRSLTLEGRFPAETVAELTRRGHLVEVDPDWSLSQVSAVAKDGPILKAAATPRLMQVYAVGR